MREIHKYTPKSVEKTVYLNVFLGALIVAQGFYSKTAIQKLSENWNRQAPKIFIKNRIGIKIEIMINIWKLIKKSSSN